MSIPAIILLAAAIVLTFMSNRYASVAAFAGLCAAAFTLPASVTPALLFWATATAIVVILSFMLPENIARSRRGVGYIAGAALAGATSGLAMSHAWMIAGAAAGAVLGAIAYSKTPAGKVLEFPSSKFLNYLCAKGLPAVITICMAGTALMWIILINF